MVIFNIILLLALCACRSKRQFTESITLSQRRGEQILYSDTIWQSFSLRLDDVTLEWLSDSVNTTQGTRLRIEAQRAELSTQHQTQTKMKAVTYCCDTIAVHQESVATALSKSSTQKWWLVLGILFLIGVLAAVLWFWLHRVRG